MRKLLVFFLMAALVIAAVAQAALTQSIEFTATYVHADRQKARGGLTLRAAFKIADDTGAKPSPVRHITYHFPKGSIANTAFFKTCAKTALATKGPAGCPAQSKIGSGTGTGDARPAIADPVSAKVTLFNGERVKGDPTILVYAVPEISSPIIVQGVLKAQRRGPYGYALDFEIPPIPVLPGQPNASVTSVDVTTLDKTVRRKGRTRHFIEGPVLCDGTFFLLEGAFSYEDGTTNTVYERFTVRGGPRCP
jgi:hypothetical protein